MSRKNRGILLVCFLLFLAAEALGQIGMPNAIALADTLNQLFANSMRDRRNAVRDSASFMRLFDSDAQNMLYFLQEEGGTCDAVDFWNMSNTTASVLSVKSAKEFASLCQTRDSSIFLIMPVSVQYKIYEGNIAKTRDKNLYFKYVYKGHNGKIVCKIGDIQKDTTVLGGCKNKIGYEIYEQWARFVLDTVSPASSDTINPLDTVPRDTASVNPVVTSPSDSSRVKSCPPTFQREYVKCQQESQTKDSIIKILIRDTIWLRDTIRVMADTLMALQKYKACLDSLEHVRKTRKADARKHIEKANNAYLFFRRNLLDTASNNEKLERMLIDTLRFCFSEYYKYSGYSGSGVFECNGMKFNIKDNYLTPKENIFYAEMLVKYKNYRVNRGRKSRVSASADLLGLISGEDKLTEANSIILWNLGQVMENGTVEEKRKIGALVELLPISIRVSNVVDGEDLILPKDVDRIYKLYIKGRYSAALDLYNRTESYFFTSVFRAKDKNCRAISRAKAAVGAILLYDYPNVMQNKDLALHGSWLSKLKNHELTGMNLLSEALRSGCLNIKDQERFNIVLSKFYSRLTK